MDRVGRIGCCLAVLAGLTCIVLAFGTVAPRALAVSLPSVPGGGPVPSARVPVHTVVRGGMPGWEVVLIALVATLLAVSAAGSKPGRGRRRAARPPGPRQL